MEFIILVFYLLSFLSQIIDVGSWFLSVVKYTQSSLQQSEEEHTADTHTLQLLCAFCSSLRHFLKTTDKIKLVVTLLVFCSTKFLLLFYLSKLHVFCTSVLVKKVSTTQYLNTHGLLIKTDELILCKIVILFNASKQSFIVWAIQLSTSVRHTCHFYKYLQHGMFHISLDDKKIKNI